jgi:hypothetical protein
VEVEDRIKDKVEGRWLVGGEKLKIRLKIDGW